MALVNSRSEIAHRDQNIVRLVRETSEIATFSA